MLPQTLLEVLRRYFKQYRPVNWLFYGVRISGETRWEFPGLGRPPATDQAAAVTGAFRGALEDADPNKQKAFIESITSGNPVNEAQQGAESALAGILGRMAAYTGKEVTWDQMMKSKEVWDPKMDWKAF